METIISYQGFGFPLSETKNVFKEVSKAYSYADIAEERLCIFKRKHADGNYNQFDYHSIITNRSNFPDIPAIEYYFNHFEEIAEGAFGKIIFTDKDLSFMDFMKKYAPSYLKQKQSWIPIEIRKERDVKTKIKDTKHDLLLQSAVTGFCRGSDSSKLLESIYNGYKQKVFVAMEYNVNVQLTFNMEPMTSLFGVRSDRVWQVNNAMDIVTFKFFNSKLKTMAQLEEERYLDDVTCLQSMFESICE